VSLRALVRESKVYLYGNIYEQKPLKGKHEEARDRVVNEQKSDLYLRNVLLLLQLFKLFRKRSVLYIL
jgi:hypothetical protein